MRTRQTCLALCSTGRWTAAFATAFFGHERDDPFGTPFVLTGHKTALHAYYPGGQLNIRPPRTCRWMW